MIHKIRLQSNHLGDKGARMLSDFLMETNTLQEIEYVLLGIGG